MSSDSSNNNNIVIERNIINKVREAVSFCKGNLEIKTNDLSSITLEDKSNIESCLRDNYLNENPSYFGNRKQIFLDLH